jgi:Big-like domain-containing protein
MRDFRISRGAVEFGTKYVLALVGVVSLAFFSTGCAGLVGASKPSSKSTAPPTVAITAPAVGATESGTVTVSATVTDGVSVASVQFQLDGATVGSPLAASPYKYVWDTTKSSNGTHTLRANARDANGNVGSSPSISVAVQNPIDSTPPTVSITAPASGTTLSRVITISANASDNVAVASVQFRVDGSNVGAAVTSVPYTYSLNTTTLANGSHTLTAVASDLSNNKATSATVSITVNNTSTGPTVSITSPLAGITVSGTITVTATASDSSGGIALVQFDVDGSNLGPADTTLPYSQSWNTTTVVDGPHILTAVANPNGTSQQPATASAVVIVNNSGSGSALSSTPGWHVIPSTALCGGGAQKNAAYTDPDNFPNNLNSSYPSYGFGFTSQCYNILEDSNSAAYDTLRHRMILYGGGHQHYWGNDVFSLELSLVNTSAPTPMFHLDHSADPLTCPSAGPVNTTVTVSNGAICRFNSTGALTTVLGHPGCTYVAGCTPTQLTSPSSVHTYNTTLYIPGYDEMTVFGGATAPNGNAGSNVWLLSMGSVLYTCAPTTTNQQGCDPTWTPVGNPALNNELHNTDGVGSTAAYDPNTQGVWMQNTSGLEWFNPADNTLTGETSLGIGYHSTAVIDPLEKYLILIGPQSTSPPEGILYINIACNNPPMCAGSNFTLNRPTTTGCANLIGGLNANPQYMGAFWDPIGKRVAIYPNAGNAIWYIDPTTWACSSETYGSTQGTDYPQNTPLPLGDAGTFGHFGYDPVLDVAILCNDPNNNCWYLRFNR